ncbi:MAG: VOC family protein [Chloroflexi bacterium]|nr:VOC family protein [Chloroflexota bacterium]MBV9898997.1 VOC family protein [Chloroflexota bacterium]
MSNPVTHFEVVGRDAEMLQRFYGEAFGWHIKPASPGYAMALPGDSRGINGGIGLPPEGGEPRVTFYVEVADLEATLQYIERLGGTRVSGPIDVPGGPSFALFADPEGHIVGIARPATATR